MIRAYGHHDDGTAVVMLGVTAEDMVPVLAGSAAITVDARDLDPRLPAVEIVLVGGPDDVVMARILARWPEAWVMPS